MTFIECKLAQKLNFTGGISGHISGGSAATYLEDQRPHIRFTVEIRLTQPQVELELGLSLAIVAHVGCLCNYCFCVVCIYISIIMKLRIKHKINVLLSAV